MSEGLDIMELRYKLNFMYAKISVPKMVMHYWMMVPEFVASVLELYDAKQTIDNRSVYDIMVRVYNEAIVDKGTKRTEGYNFAKMRRGIRGLEEVLQLKPHELIACSKRNRESEGFSAH